MTTNYLKVNPKVVAALGLSQDRNRLPDGNYLLFWRELRNLGLGGLLQYDSVMARVGAVALTPAEAVAEQNGSACKPLPAATDPAYYVEPPVPEEPAAPEEGFAPADKPADELPEEPAPEHDSETTGEEPEEDAAEGEGDPDDGSEEGGGAV